MVRQKRTKERKRNKGRKERDGLTSQSEKRTNGVSRMSLPVLLGSLAALAVCAGGLVLADPGFWGRESTGWGGGAVHDISWKVIRTSMAVISFQFIDRYLLLDFHIADALHSEKHPVAVRSVMVGSWMLLLCTFLYVFAVL